MAHGNGSPEPASRAEQGARRLPRCRRCGRRPSERSLLEGVGVALCRPCFPRFQEALHAWLDATRGASTEP